MNRFERLVRIHQLLKRGAPVPMRQMTEQLGVARSTIVRDLEYLRDFFDAPIEYDREANGHRYDPRADAFELPGLWLNQSELYALLATEQLLEAAQPGLLSPYIGPLRARVRRLLGASGGSAEQLADRIRLLDAPRRTLEVENFSLVAEGVLARRQLAFGYHSRSRDELRERRVDPQRLLHYRGNWFLLAHCHEAGALRLFSVDRIRTARVLEAPAPSLAGKVLDRFIGASFGIFSGTATAWASLRFEERAARWVAEESWHPDQIGIWEDGRYLLQVPYADETELVMEILRYGPEVEVLAPPELRAEVARRLRDAAARY